MEWQLITAAGDLNEQGLIREGALRRVVVALLEQSPSLFDFDQDVEAVRISDGLRLSGSQLVAFLEARPGQELG
jgi:hypothetical protein